MRFFEETRAVIFWLKDFVSGGNKKRCFEETKKMLEDYHSREVSGKRTLYLEKILEHAADTVPFYRSYAGLKTLGDFPVINKSIIRESQEDFFSTDYKYKELHKVTTSGSTGAPLSIWQDKGKRGRHIAENIYFSEIAGYHPGSRLYYLRVWNEINRKGSVKSRAENIIMQDAGDLSDDNLELFIRKLERDRSTKSILAFSSTFEALAQFISMTGRSVNAEVNCLIAISESLPDGAREVLKEAFRCPVISRYSNMENGFLAQQCGDDSGEYHLNTAGFYFELLHPDRNEPVRDGETGRVVVTDLFNYAMPIIRYDTGDMAVKKEHSSCGIPGPVFSLIEGRRVDFIYSTAGSLLSPHVITNTMWRYSESVRQFQFVQNDANHYIIRINTGEHHFDREADMVSDLKGYVGSEAIVDVEYVNEIPALASGKRKKIINNYIN